MRQYVPGDRIAGEYTVLKVFGGKDQSGMGVVYLVENREVPWPFVMKTFQDEVYKKAKDQFLSEARAWVQAGTHSNIVQAYWAREYDGQLFVAAEYIEPDMEGRNSLSQYLANGNLRIEIVLHWAAQFCYGMDYARSRGVLVHRDIKPDNLLINKSGVLKVTDFGLSKSVDLDVVPRKNSWWPFSKRKASNVPSRTQLGWIKGTVPYMPPEQFFASSVADHRADIYSFGIILYQMVTGNQYPYKIRPDVSDVTAEFFRAHIQESPTPIDSPLSPIIRRCLQKQPGHRYASYDALLSDLRSVAKALHIKLPSVAHTTNEDEELYAQAQSYAALGDKDRALKAIDEYVSKYSENECGWTEKGRLHSERGEYALALAATRKSLEVNPYNTHAWNNLGIQLGRTGSPIATIKEAFANALRFDPVNTAAMMNLVVQLSKKKEFAEAVNITVKALTLQPDKPIVSNNAYALLNELFDNNQIDIATVLLFGLTEARPEDATAWEYLGLISKDEGALDRAIECFQRVHALSPKDNSPVVQLAKLTFLTKKTRECIGYCEVLLQRGHEPLLAVDLKARALDLISGYEQALQFLQPHLDHNPMSDTLWVVQADIHESHRNYSAAIKALLHAQSILLRTNGEHQVDNLQFLAQKLDYLATIG